MSPTHGRYWLNMFVLGAFSLAGWIIYRDFLAIAKMMGAGEW
jgi:hypothetical protein